MITVNGQARETERPVTIAELLAQLGHPDRGVAVALDGTVVPKTLWPTTALEDNAIVEIVTAVQGG